MSLREQSGRRVRAHPDRNEETPMHTHGSMRGRHGRPPWAGREWGADRGNWRGGGRRMRRGDIRTALLGGLSDGPAHGYELIGRLEGKSGGTWRPSPGPVY